MNKRIKVVMNERIKELAKLAQLRAEWMTPQGLEWFDNFKEQYAELIVKETMQVVANNLPQNTYLDVADAVIEHFGVAEREH